MQKGNHKTPKAENLKKKLTDELLATVVIVEPLAPLPGPEPPPPPPLPCTASSATIL